MKIGVDFDNCYGSDPEAWSKVVDVLHASGHECVLVTKRPPDNDEAVREVMETVSGQMPLVFCGKRYKDDVASEHGHEIDVWIDDHPEFIRSPNRLKEKLNEAKTEHFKLKRKLDKMKSLLKRVVDVFC